MEKNVIPRAAFLSAIAILLNGCDNLNFQQEIATEEVPKELHGSYMLLEKDMQRFVFIGSGARGTFLTYVQMQGETAPHSGCTCEFLAEKLKGRDVMILYANQEAKKKKIFTVAKYKKTDVGISYNIHRSIAGLIENGTLKASFVEDGDTVYKRVEGTLEVFLDNPVVRWYGWFDMRKIGVEVQPVGDQRPAPPPDQK